MAAGAIVGEDHRTFKCGRTRCAEIVTVHTNGEGRAGYRGIYTCGSVWTCPVCASAIASRRAVEVEELCRAHVKAGGQVYMATLTVRHGTGDDCGELRKLVSKAWHNTMRSGSAKRMRELFNIVGYVRSIEVTHGGHGWHPHIHVLWFTRRLEDAESARLADQLYDRWAAVLEKLGHDCERSAYDFQLARNVAGAAAYVSKWGAGTEIAKGAEKLGRKVSRSPWQLLDDADAGDDRAADLFAAYAVAFHGARHLTYAQGIRELYDLREPADDEQLALDDELPEFEGEGAGEVYRFAPETWRAVIHRRLTAAVLAAAEKDGFEGVHNLLCDFGIPPSPYRPRPSDGREQKPRGTAGGKVHNWWSTKEEIRNVHKTERWR